MFKREIGDLLARDFDVRFDERKQLVADFTPHGIEAALEQLLSDESVDVVLAHGVVASNSAVEYHDLPKTCLAPFVADADAQGLVGDDGKRKQRKNLSYVVWSTDLDRDLKAFARLGDFRKIAWIHSQQAGEAIPGLLERAQRMARRLSVSLTMVPAGRTAASVLDRLPKDVDAVYLAHNPQLNDPEIEKLAQGLIERRLPSFSWYGRAEVERGLMSGLSSPDAFTRLARRVALNLQTALLGDVATGAGTAFKQSEQLVINLVTARAVGVWPDFAVLTDAVLLGDKKKRVARQLTLAKAVGESMNRNLDLAAMRQRVLAGEQEIRRARSQLLPHLALYASGAVIDEDRAGLGQAERTAEWGGSLRQTVFSEQAWGNLAVQKRLQASRVHQEQSLKLDIVEQTATAYLTVLQAQTLERIQRENAALSRENLALARVRNQVGMAGPGEVLRWEAQLANARSAVIDAIAQRNQAEILLNRLMDRPLEEPFLTRETSLDDQGLLSSDPRFREHLSNPLLFKILREFMVGEAKRVAPELKQISSLELASRRRLTSARRSLWLPTLGLNASAGHQFYRGGVGSEPLELPPGSPDLPLPDPDRINWYVGLSAELPLYEGGARYADIDQSKSRLAELDAQRKATEALIAQRVRSALHRAGAAFAGIRLAEAAAKASRDNLEVVQEAYSRGTQGAIVLLDAQNQALVAELAASNSVYAFLLRLMEVERGIGTFSLFMSQQQRDSLFSRLETYQRQRAAQMGARSLMPRPAAPGTPSE
jgi:outer membrane protein TolC